jgi:DNA primase
MRGIRLKRATAPETYAGRCPFPRCRKSALVVMAGKELFHCTECRAGGNAQDLVVKLDGCDYRQAAETLLAALPLIRKPARPEGGPDAPAA